MDGMSGMGGMAAEPVTTRNRFGNAAKLQEALQTMVDFWEIHGCAYSVRVFPVRDNEEEVESMRVSVMEKAKEALSAQPRNCDVWTAEEQADRFFRFCNGHQGQIEGMCDPHCPCIKEPDKCHCLTKWAQMPYTATQEGCAE